MSISGTASARLPRLSLAAQIAIGMAVGLAMALSNQMHWSFASAR